MNTSPPGSQYEPRPGGEDLTPRHHHAQRTTTPTEPTAMTFTNTADTVFRHHDLVILLRENPYRSSAAQIPDDGIIDATAVDRFASGDTTVRLSPREVVCVVAQLAASGESDQQIAERFGRPDEAGSKWIQRLRSINRVPAAEPRFTAAELASVLTNPSSRAKASQAKLRAAGVIL